MKIKETVTKAVGQLLCLAGCHAWTSNALLGERPTQEQINKGAEGFWEFARIYCKRCGIESESELYKKYKKGIKHE